MNCEDARKLLHPYIDGELDLVNSLAVEQHLHDCPECAQEYKNLLVLHSRIQDNAPYYKTPAAARKRLQAAVWKAGQADQVTRESPSARVVKPWQWLGALAALAAIVLLAFGMARSSLLLAPADDVLAQEVISSHVRSQMTDHLADVASTDQHTVKPWFSGKLDFSPPVVDLSGQGYPLYGGRLDYLDNRPVAALVYRRDQHVINLFIWPSADGRGAADGGGAAAKTEISQGYNLAHWSQAGMKFWAITDLNAGEFQQFVQLVQSQTP